MRLAAGLLGLVLVCLGGTPSAQAQTLVCQALQGRLDQSPILFEGRLLNEALLEAAALDCVVIADDLLTRGASVKARNRRGATPLNVAAEHGSREVAARLIGLGADIEHRDLAGVTPLLGAAREGRRRMAGLLLDAGAKIDGSDKQNITPLMAAVFEGDLRMVKMFLEAGADIEAADIHGKGALIYAAGRAFPKVVATLLEAGAEVDGAWGNELTPLMWAAGHANDAPASDGIAVVTQLLEAGARLGRQDDRGRNALMIAAARGNRQIVAFLLERGSDPSARDNSGLMAADLASDDEIRNLLNE